MPKAVSFDVLDRLQENFTATYNRPENQKVSISALHSVYDVSASNKQSRTQFLYFSWPSMYENITATISSKTPTSDGSKCIRAKLCKMNLLELHCRRYGFIFFTIQVGENHHWEIENESESSRPTRDFSHSNL